MKLVRISEALAEATTQLAASDSARLDAEVLLGHVLGQSRTWLHTWSDRYLDPTQLGRFRQLIERRAAGEPVAYLVGVREFWTLALKVTPATLIPRPETELLVEAALARAPADRALDILDLGTGSGAIALAMACERPGSRVVAVERSAEALAVARANGERLALANVEFLAGSWFEAVAGRRFHLILANPPYVADNDPHLALGDLPFEPPEALAAGNDGLADLRHIIATAPAHLQDGGWLLVEHGYDQGAAVRDLFTARGFTNVTSMQDLAAQDRITLGTINA